MADGVGEAGAAPDKRADPGAEPAVPKIELRFTLNAQDLLAAKSEGAVVPPRSTVVGIAIVAAVYQLLSIAYASLFDEPNYYVAAAIAAGAAVWTLIALKRRRARLYERVISQSPALNGPQSWTLSTGGVHVERPFVTTDASWQAFVRCVETRRFFLLYLTRLLPAYLPKSAMRSEEEVVAIRSLLSKSFADRFQSRGATP